MKVLIVSGGNPPSESLLMEEVLSSDYIIGVDKGCNFLFEKNIIPNQILGDFDSISKEVFEIYKNKVKTISYFPIEKDETDTELAISKAIELKASSISILGATGTRIDHFFGNLGLLLRCLNENIDCCIKDDHNVIFLKNKSFNLKGSKGNYFSIQSYFSNIKNISIKNAKYPLSNYELKIGDPLTISNEFIDGDVNITFDSGILVVMLCKD